LVLLWLALRGMSASWRLARCSNASISSCWTNTFCALLSCCGAQPTPPSSILTSWQMEFRYTETADAVMSLWFTV
jgi:hypothetical protein